MRFTTYLDGMPAGRRAAAVAALANASERLDLAVRRIWDAAPAEGSAAALAAERALAAALDALAFDGPHAAACGHDGVSMTEALDAATEARDQLVRALAGDESPESIASFVLIALESLADAQRAASG